MFYRLFWQDLFLGAESLLKSSITLFFDFVPLMIFIGVLKYFERIFSTARFALPFWGGYLVLTMRGFPSMISSFLAFGITFIDRFIIFLSFIVC